MGRMQWSSLLCAQREVASPGGRAREGDRFAGGLRSEFEKDYHRIIGSSSFRRLQDKTQVFALDKSDFIRTRLTHSLEVSSFAKSLGQNIASALLESHMDPGFTYEMKGDVCDILLCAGLIHDIGNPPFGHFGEEAIRDWFARRMKRLRYKEKPVAEILSAQMVLDFLLFEGNAQALRQVARLHFLVNEHGMNLTYALLGTIIKYPVPSTGVKKDTPFLTDKKVGYFYAEQELYKKIGGAMGIYGVRHPLTFILEAADDIAYRTADIEDACKKGMLSYDILKRELVLAREKAMREGFLVEERLNPVRLLESAYAHAVSIGSLEPGMYAVQNFLLELQGQLISCATRGFLQNYEDIMEGRYQHDLFYQSRGDWIIRSLGDIAMRYAFLSRQILQMEVSVSTILNFLMDRFVPAIIHYDTTEPMGMMQEKMVHLISDNYRQAYLSASEGKSEQEKLYLRLLLVTDFISGMTDSYAKDLYQKLNGIT